MDQPSPNHPLDKFSYKLTEHRRQLLQKVVDQRIRHFTMVLDDLKAIKT